MEEEDVQGGGELGAREARVRFVRAVTPAAHVTYATGTFPRRPPPPPPPPPPGFLAALEDGVQFPAMHWAWSSDIDLKDPSEAWTTRNPALVFEGRYREVRAIRPMGAPESEAAAWASARGPDAGCAYLVLGFRSATCTNGGTSALARALLATWRDWSGARHLYFNLPDELRLARVALLQRQHPARHGDKENQQQHQQAPFEFLVLAACRCAQSPLLQARLLDFAQRFRAQRVSAAYVSVYSGQSARSIATL